MAESVSLESSPITGQKGAMARKAFPRTHAALILEGYKFLFAGNCREPACGAAIRWYLTPLRRRMPVDVERKIPHFLVCKALEKERAERRRQAAERRSRQKELFPW